MAAVAEQLIEIAAAILILVAFAAAQTGAMRPSDRRYLVLNLAGSAVLTVLAAHDGDLGFLLLEGVWAVVSAWGLIRLIRGGPPRAAGT
jgi:hypothetical protein